MKRVRNIHSAFLFIHYIGCIRLKKIICSTSFFCKSSNSLNGVTQSWPSVRTQHHPLDQRERAARGKIGHVLCVIVTFEHVGGGSCQTLHRIINLRQSHKTETCKTVNLSALHGGNNN